MNQLVNNDPIHFNKRKRICFDRAEQKETKMRLQYELFYAEIICQCLQQVNDPQSVAMKINLIIIMKKLSFSKNKHSEKKFYNEKMLIKIYVARHENDFSVRKIS